MAPMTGRQRLAVWLVALAVVIVHSPLPDPLVLALVLATGAFSMHLIYGKNHSND